MIVEGGLASNLLLELERYSLTCLFEFISLPLIKRLYPPALLSLLTVNSYIIGRHADPPSEFQEFYKC